MDVVLCYVDNNGHVVSVSLELNMLLVPQLFHLKKSLMVYFVNIN